MSGIIYVTLVVSFYYSIRLCHPVLGGCTQYSGNLHSKRCVYTPEATLRLSLIFYCLETSMY